MKKQEPVLWRTLESEEGITLKQHGFIGKYDGSSNEIRNMSLCGQVREACPDWGYSQLISKMWDEGSEKIDEEKACKNCLRSYKTRSHA